MHRFFLLLYLFISIASCTSDEPLKQEYIGFLKANDSINIPFNFTLKDSLFNISNSTEKVSLLINQTDSDSLILTSFIFEDVIIYKNYNDSLKGFYYNKSLSRKIPFSARLGNERFQIFDPQNSNDFSGNWHVVFNPRADNRFDSEMMIDQNNKNIGGTLRTETGDYGFMQGVSDGKRLSMSNFNGYRAYMIDGQIQNDTINGYMYRGNYDAIPFKAYKDANFNLSDPYELTKMKQGYDDFVFNFENINGEFISNTDKKFKDKIVLIQLMGTWCPNCLDESRYLSKLVENLDDVMLVSIAFEYAKEKKQALNNLRKLKSRLNIEYDLLLAQYGSSSKINAAEKLISLDTVISYPTLIIVDKDKRVGRIHTGFNGPATGNKFEYFKKDFEEYLYYLRR